MTYYDAYCFVDVHTILAWILTDLNSESKLSVGSKQCTNPHELGFRVFLPYHDVL